MELELKVSKPFLSDVTTYIFKKNELVPLDEYFKIVLNFVVQHFIMYHSSTTTTDMTIILNIKLVQFFREINFTKISLKKNDFTTIFMKMISQCSIRLSHPLTPLTMTFFRFRIEFGIDFKMESNPIRIRTESKFYFSSMQHNVNRVQRTYFAPYTCKSI